MLMKVPSDIATSQVEKQFAPVRLERSWSAWHECTSCELLPGGPEVHAAEPQGVEARFSPCMSTKLYRTPFGVGSFDLVMNQSPLKGGTQAHAMNESKLGPRVSAHPTGLAKTQKATAASTKSHSPRDQRL